MKCQFSLSFQRTGGVVFVLSDVTLEKIKAMNALNNSPLQLHRNFK